MGRLSVVVTLIALMVPAAFSGAEATTAASCRNIGEIWLAWPDGYSGCCLRGQHAEMRNEPGHEHRCVGGHISIYTVGECRCPSPRMRCVIASGGQRECHY